MLLTRPPLNRVSVQALLLYSARLACVRHAASVHPEPGSNSRIIAIREPFGSLITFLDSSKGNRLKAFRLFIAVQFSRSVSPRSSKRLAILSLPLGSVNKGFWCFYPNFQACGAMDSRLSRKRAGEDYIAKTLPPSMNESRVIEGIFKDPICYLFKGRGIPHDRTASLKTTKNASMSDSSIAPYAHRRKVGNPEILPG